MRKVTELNEEGFKKLIDLLLTFSDAIIPEDRRPASKLLLRQLIRSWLIELEESGGSRSSKD